MEQVKIQELTHNLVKGVEVQLPGEVAPYRETYFEWSGSSLLAHFQTKEISGGVLRCWHHVPVFSEIETHVDAEFFYFVSGTALMLFMDMDGGKPDLSSAQVVRIRPGTQLVIPAGKPHFVAVAAGDERVEMIVVAPRMDAPRMSLPMAVQGVE